MMKFYQRLRFKLVLAFFFATLIPLLFTGFYAIYTSTNSLHNQAINSQQESVQTLKNNIEMFLATVQGDLMFLAETVPLKSYLKFRAENTGSTLDQTQREQLH
jgi:hypothetical protein